MGWGIAGWDSPSGLFCIVFPFELQIGGRQKCWNVSCGRLHRETSKSRNRKPTEGHYFSEENTDSKAKFKACDLCCSFWTTWIIWLPWCSGKKKFRNVCGLLLMRRINISHVTETFKKCSMVSTSPCFWNSKFTTIICSNLLVYYVLLVFFYF